MQEPHLVINYFAILVSVLASFVFGALWFGPICGKKWAEYMGMKMDHKPSPSFMMKLFAIQIFGTLLTSYVLAHSGQVWRPSVWNGSVQDGGTDAMYGFMCAAFTWLGFYIPMLLGTVTWENRPWGLFGINAAYHFINLQIICQILAHWR